MVSATTLCKEIVNVKGFVVDDATFCESGYQEKSIVLKGHLQKGLRWRCPVCGKRSKVYDIPYSCRRWRALDFGGIPAFIEMTLPRVECPKHGVLAADVPWAFPGSRFTKDFEYTVTWMGKYLNRTAISKYMRVDWATVGRCIGRVHDDLEPDVGVRLDGLEEIGIDETSYRKGHSYITVVTNKLTSSVVWAAKGHGKEVLTQFFEALTPEQRASIKVVSADGARWITDCVNEFCPNAVRCIDPFHVVQWATEALDSVRSAAWRKAQKVAKECAVKRGRGRLRQDDTEAQAALEARKAATKIKSSKYALGKAPEHLTHNQEVCLEMIRMTDPRLYRAYQLKEKLRLIFKLDDVVAAEEELMAWVKWARHCRIPEFVELQRKIMRHKDHILNSIRFNASNAQHEATNNKIKLLIRQAYGFHDVDNMIHMVLLYCSDIKIPLPNRGTRKGFSALAA